MRACSTAVLVEVSSRRSSIASEKRKLWTDESMVAAYQAVLDGKGLRETSRLYNVPVETLRRRVNGSVGLSCRPGPATILTDEQEDLLCEYIIKIAHMGYGLTKEDVQHLAYSMAEKIHSKSQKKGGRNALNGKTVCITDPKVVEELKAKEAEKADVEEKKSEDGQKSKEERTKRKGEKEEEKRRHQRQLLGKMSRHKRILLRS